MKKLIMMTILLLSLSGFLHPGVAAAAETKEIVAEGTYMMGDGETPIVAEGRAVEQAKRIAVEQAGTYVKSYTRVKNFQIADDDIEVLASGMMEITIIDRKRSLEADAVKFWVRIKAIVKPDNIEVIAERVKEQGLGQEYEKIKAAFDQSQEEVMRLKKELALAKAEPERREIIGRLTQQEKEFQSRQLHAAAVREFAAGRTEEALAFITRLIGENPNFPPAHLLRGFVYFKQAKFDLACPDFEKAAELMPTSAKAHAGRGACRRRNNQCDTAIADLKRSLQLDPNPPQELKAKIHANLGGCLLHEGKRAEAKEHLQTACKLGERESCKIMQRAIFNRMR